MTDNPPDKPPARRRAQKPLDTPTRDRRTRKPRTGGKTKSDVTTGRFVTKLTDQVVATICDSIQKGAAPETACTVAGVAVSTFRQWLADGRAWIDTHAEDEIPIPQAVFTMGVEKALANQKMTLEQRLGQEKDWRAAAHMLERRWPKEWGKRERLDIGNPDGETFSISGYDLSILDREELVTLKGLLLKLQQGHDGGTVIDMPARRRELGTGG